VRPWVDKDVDLEAVWQGAQQLDPDAEPDDGGHGAVGHGGREENADVVFLVLHLDEAKVHDLELLERELRVLWIPQGAQKLCVRSRMTTTTKTTTIIRSEERRRDGKDIIDFKGVKGVSLAVHESVFVLDARPQRRLDVVNDGVWIEDVHAVAIR